MLYDRGGRAVQVGAYVGSPTLVSLTVVSANTQLTSKKVYRAWSSVDAFFVTGSSNAVAATTSSHPLKAGLDVLLYIDPLNTWVAGIVSSGTGTLFLSEYDVATYSELT